MNMFKEATRDLRLDGGLGSEGFASALLRLHVLGVLAHDELIGWLRLHGDVLRLAPPLDDGSGIDEATFAGLQAELGRELATAPTTAEEK